MPSCKTGSGATNHKFISKLHPISHNMADFCYVWHAIRKQISSYCIPRVIITSFDAGRVIHEDLDVYMDIGQSSRIIGARICTCASDVILIGFEQKVISVVFCVCA